MKTKQLPNEPFFRRQTPLFPKGDINNTPIRVRDNKQNNQGNFPSIPISNKQRDTLKNNESSQNSPYSIDSLSSKTIPRRKPSTVLKPCANHYDLQAEFKIHIDGEPWNYCAKCAAHLASNGFEVERLTQTKSPIRIKESSRSPYNTYNKRKQELTVFLNSLKQLSNGYSEKQQYIKKASLSHNIEKETITNFYASMFEYLQYMRDQHLHFLQEQAQKNTQIGEIQAAEIAETLEEIGGMTEDIENNVDKIVEEVEQHSYNECMSYYNQKKEVHEHRLSQLGIDVRTASCTTADYVEEKLAEFKDFIDELTGILGSKAESAGY